MRPSGSTGFGYYERIPLVIIDATFGIRQSAGSTDFARTNQGVPDATAKALQNSNQHRDQPHFLRTAISTMYYVLGADQLAFEAFIMRREHSTNATKVGFN